jgi:hypothetical protein
VAELLKTRKEPASESPARPAWQRFLESAGGAALVTVLLGTLAAGIINALVQDKIKERGLKLASYSEELKQLREVDTGILDISGRLMGATEDLIALTSNVFDPKQFSRAQQKVNTNQRTQIRLAWNAADEKWRLESEKLALLLRLHSGQTDVIEAWRNARRSVNTYKDCGADWYLGHAKVKKFVPPDEVTRACSEKKTAAKESLDKLADAMAKAAQTLSQ